MIQLRVLEITARAGAKRETLLLFMPHWVLVAGQRLGLPQAALLYSRLALHLLGVTCLSLVLWNTLAVGTLA